MAGRKVKQWSEVEFVRNRYNVWIGSDMPKTISAKELSDNALDQVADGLAKRVLVAVGRNSVAVIDDGAGISMEKDKESGKTHLFLAVGKLYTSSNYEGTENLTGVNGVGSTVTNALSSCFHAGYVKDSVFKGYVFHNGVHKDEGKTFDVIADFKDPDLGSLPFDGYYVRADYDSSVLSDSIDVEWLCEYIKDRVGELPEGAYVEVYDLVNGVVKYYNKYQGDKNYVKSWLEKVKESPGVEVVETRDGWKYAFSKEEDGFKDVRSIVSGAPVSNHTTVTVGFEVEEYNVNVSIPVTFKYSGKAAPRYTDQTKRRVVLGASDVARVLKAKAPSVYNYYKAKAEEKYLAHVLKKNENEMFWPAIGGGEDQELIIAEGYSAASAIKNRRDPKKQACLALKGKILNVIQKDLKDAMKSDVVKQILSVVTKYKYDRIIIAVDADADGSHIFTLLMGLFYRFARSFIEEGKVYYCNTPLYVFTKGKDIKWSNSKFDCPPGYKISVKKGLGSLTAKEIELFVTNPETRDLWQLAIDERAQESLWEALAEGCKHWIA